MWPFNIISKLEDRISILESTSKLQATKLAFAEEDIISLECKQLAGPQSIDDEIKTLQNLNLKLINENKLLNEKLENAQAEKLLTIAKLHEEFQQKSYEQFITICSTAMSNNNKETKALFETILNKLKGKPETVATTNDTNYKAI